MARPTKMHDVVNRLPIRDPNTGEVLDYRPVTRTEQIVDDVRVGMTAERAARRAGIHKDTFYEWENIAATVREGLAAGTMQRSKLTKRQRDCMEFSDAVAEADAVWETTCNGLLEQLGRGEFERVIVTTQVDPTTLDVISRREQREKLLPDAKVLMWRLQHRYPQQYGGRLIIAGEGEGGAVPIEVRAAALAEAVESFRRSQDGAELVAVPSTNGGRGA